MRTVCGVLLALGGLLWISTAVWPKFTVTWPAVPALQAFAFIGGMATVFGFALLLKAKRAVAILAVMVLVTVLAPRLGTITVFGSEPSMRVMSLNTHLGDADVNALAATVKEINPDVLALSETNPEEIRQVVDATDFVALNHAEPGAGGADGVVLLGNRHGKIASLVRTADMSTPSSDPTSDHAFATLATDTDRTVFQMPSLWLPSWHSPTSKLGAVDDQQVRIAGVHVVAPMGTRDRQTWSRELESLNDWAQTQNRVGNVVMMGDFNATRWHPRMRDFSGFRDCYDSAAAQPTWPKAAPVLRLDHILTNGSCGDAGAIAVPGTDHLAVWADVSFKDD